MVQLIATLEKEDIVKLIADKYEVDEAMVDVLPIQRKTKDGRKYWNKLKQRLKEEAFVSAGKMLGV